jgi:hypothetical protein
LIENNKKGFEMKKNIIVCALVIVNISNVHAKNGGLGAMFAEIIGNAVGSVAGKSMADSGVPILTGRKRTLRNFSQI